MELVDTNVVLRFLVGDETKQQKQAIIWFKEAEQGKRKVGIKVIVIAEVCFVLESFYKHSRREISEALTVFLSQKWLQVEERETLLTLWKWYQQKLHFVDSYLLATAQSNKSQILTFDKELLKKVSFEF